MEDAQAGQLVRHGSAAGSGATEAADTDGGGAGTAPEGGQRTGGRRYRAGRPPPRRRGTAEQPRVPTTPFPSGFGAWGTLGGLFACCLVSCLLAAWLHFTVVAGLGFCAGCAIAAWYCRPAALLRMVIAVPAVFAAAEILAQLATLPGGSGRRGLALPVAGGTLLTLAAVAPWLFAGTAVAIAIALFRGLPQCVRDLRAELRGQPPARRAPRARQAPRVPRG
jgi:hypothetical protein